MKSPMPRLRDFLGALLMCALLPQSALSAEISGSVHETPEIQAEIERLSEAGFNLLLARSKRLSRVSEKIRLHGADLCARRLGPVLGLVVVTKDELPLAFHAPVAKRHPVDDLIRVLWALPGFPADRAGLIAGDVIVSVSGKSINGAGDLRRLRLKGSNSLDRSLPFEIRRGKETLSMDVEIWPGCEQTADIVISDAVNAWAIQHLNVIGVTTGLLRFAATDDELAIVIGHELGHHIFFHQPGGGRGRSLEAASDYLGLYLAARAGFDISSTVEFWERLSLRTKHGLTFHVRNSHPSSRARTIALEATIREIQGKLERGEPLDPFHQ